MEKLDILVVDDSENFRELIKDFLEQQQEVQKVTTAVSGKEAIEHLEKFTPKVILMDIVMPDLNGFETSEIIRSKFPDMPIIILSGNEVTDAHEMIEKFKLNGFVNKINLVSELIPAIFKSLRKRK